MVHYSMTSLASSPDRRQIDDSLPAVILVLIAIAAVISAVVLLWWQVAPHSPAPVATYIPLPNGASYVYRITNPDGTITYRARNIHAGPATQIFGELEVNTFTALMTAANITLETGAEAQALQALAKFRLAVYDDVEYDPQGKVLGKTQTYALLRPDRIEIFGVNTVGISPPLPLLQLGAPPATLAGKLNDNIPFTFNYRSENLPQAETGLGTLRDCIRVEQTLEFNNSRTDSTTTYCAGIGEVLDKTIQSGTAGVKQSELVAASVGSYIKGSAPVSLKQDASARLESAFTHGIGTALVETFNYKEPAGSNGITTQIVPVDSLLLFGTANGALVAVDRASEQEQWRFQTGAAIYSTPIVANGNVYFGSADKKLYALRLADGTFEWAFRTQDIVSASPQVGQDVIFVASEDKHLYALDPDTGLRRWTFAAAGPLVAQPVVTGDTVFFSTDGGALFALNVATGSQRWSFSADRAITAPVTVAGAQVLVSSYDGTVTALNISDGSVVWQADLVNEIESQPVVANGRVFVTLPNELFALDATDGSILWRYRSERTLKGAPLLMGDQVWQLSLTGLIGLSANTGIRYLEIPTADASPTGGLSSNGRELFAGFFDGHLLAFGGAAP